MWSSNCCVAAISFDVYLSRALLMASMTSRSQNVTKVKVHFCNFSVYFCLFGFKLCSL